LKLLICVLLYDLSWIFTLAMLPLRQNTAKRRVV
jgi:hypothetical protein